MLWQDNCKSWVWISVDSVEVVADKSERLTLNIYVTSGLWMKAYDMSRRLLSVFWAFILLRMFVLLHAGDYWQSAGEAGVMTTNDCGTISAVVGNPVIRRSFLGKNDNGNAIFTADRLYSGDEIIVPKDSRLELTSRNNILIALSPETTLRLNGLRGFAGPGGEHITRLDIHLVKGEIRIQVRLNENNPEAVQINLDNAEILVSRGDVAVYSADGWRASVLTGQAQTRLRRGDVLGVPFVVDAAHSMGTSGEGECTIRELNAIKDRIPFSFELVQAALPPMPIGGSDMDGP